MCEVTGAAEGSRLRRPQVGTSGTKRRRVWQLLVNCHAVTMVGDHVAIGFCVRRPAVEIRTDLRTQAERDVGRS